MGAWTVGPLGLTGNQVIERPARKYPPTVPRLARLEDYETDEGEELTSLNSGCLGH